MNARFAHWRNESEPAHRPARVHVTAAPAPRNDPRQAVMRPAVAFWGVLAGVGGATHAVGELLQGGGRPSGVVFDSWTTEPIATNLGGETAMTLVPDLRVTAILTALTSLTVILWSALRLRGPRGPTGLALASVAMMLFGGGFGPPVVGLVTALAAHLGRRADRGAGTPRGPGVARRSLAFVWPALFWLVMADMVVLFLGSIPLALAGINVPTLFVGFFFLAAVGVPLTALTAPTLDRGRRPHPDDPSATGPEPGDRRRS